MRYISKDYMTPNGLERYLLDLSKEKNWLQIYEQVAGECIERYGKHALGVWRDKFYV